MCRAILTAMAILSSGVAFAQVEAPAVTGDGRPANPRNHEGDVPGEEQKERVATAAIFLLALVAFTGLALLALVIFWGYRTRRIARSPLPATRQGDPFWYLRPKKGLPEDGKDRSGSE